MWSLRKTALNAIQLICFTVSVVLVTTVTVASMAYFKSAAGIFAVFPALVGAVFIFGWISDLAESSLR